MNHNTPARDSSCGVGIVATRAELVIVNHRAIGAISVLHPDLDTEFIDSASSINVTVPGGEHEVVRTGDSLNGALALVLGFRPSYYEPLIEGAVEVQVCLP